MSQKKESEEHAPAAEEVVRAFNRGKNFLEEVLRENERLRYRVLHLQQELARVAQEHASRRGEGDVASENAALRRQLHEIKAQFDALNKENEDFRQRYSEVERQNENLLNLYVSGYQLHSTLNEGAVLTIIKEILLNLVGAEVFGVWLLDAGSGRMTLVNVTDECDLFGGSVPRLPAVVREAVRAGEQWFAQGAGKTGEPLCVIPLKLEEQTVGALAIFKLLVQKTGGFSSLDQELLGLLASQAAATLIGARTFTRGGGTLAWAADDDGSAVALD